MDSWSGVDRSETPEPADRAVLNERGVETSRGSKWQSMTVARLLSPRPRGVIDPWLRGVWGSPGLMCNLHSITTISFELHQPAFADRGIVRECERRLAAKRPHVGELFRTKDCDEAILAGTVNNNSLVEHLRPRTV